MKQTQQYCRGNYKAWDPKITTFPGLYIVAAAAARLLQRVSQLLPGLEKVGTQARLPQK